MAATTPQVLFAEAACFCAVTYQDYETLKLAMLSRIAQTLGVTMTINQLLDYGNCFGCLGLTSAQTAELALLDLISANVSGGGSGTPEVLDTYPAAPTDPTKAALSYPSGGGTLYQWDVGSQAWV